MMPLATTVVNLLGSPCKDVVQAALWEGYRNAEWGIMAKLTSCLLKAVLEDVSPIQKLPSAYLIGTIEYADELQFSADTISRRASLFPADPLTPGRGVGGVGWLEWLLSFKNWDIVRKFRKLTRHKLGPIVTKSHHWRFCFERWEENSRTADHWPTLQIRTTLFWIVSSPPEIDLSVVRLRWPKVDFFPKTVLTIGSSNQNDAKWFDESIVTIWSRHSDEHARLLCTSEGHTGKGHVKGAHWGLAVQRGRH